jgi:hydrogenase maturation protease
MKGKVLFLGIGNGILSDDGAGIRVIEEIRAIVGEREGIEFDSGNVNSYRLIDIIEGYEKVVIVDAMKSGAKIGTLHKIPVKKLKDRVSSFSIHTIDLGSAMKFGREMGATMPKEVSLYGIEVEDTETFSEDLTPNVSREIPSIAREILSNEGIDYG